MTWTLAFEPTIDLAILAVLAVLGAALVVASALRGARGIWLRALAVAALALALANPVILREDRESLGTVVALVVDESASQGLPDRTAETEAMRAALAERIGALDGIELRTIRAEPGPAEDGTNLFAAAEAGLADVPPDRVGAVIMLTDGQVHDVPDATASAFGSAPIHALVSGTEDERDRRIVIDAAPRFGIVGEEQTITYRVLDDGTAGGAPVAVTFIRDGETIATQTVAAGAESQLRFDLPHGGENLIEIEAAPLDGELTALNNRAIVTVTGIRENLRVLLVSGEPHAGERTWRNLLTSDPAVDLIHFTILRPPEKQDITPMDELSLIEFPTRELFEEKIDGFDLIIFDRYQERGILPLVYFDNLARYVADGGAILVAAGPDDAGYFSIYNTPLGDILPAHPTGEAVEAPFLPTVTEAGARHPVTRGLAGAETDPPSWGRWFRRIAVEDVTGDVVMSDDSGEPLLVLGHEGEGRVALLLSDQAWLWARGFEGGGPHVDLLRRLSHWLMQEPDLDEERLRATASGGNVIIERQTMAATAGPVTVTPPTEPAFEATLAEAEPGVWRAVVPATEVGLWEITEGDLAAVVHVGPPNPREFLAARSTTEVLAPIAARTGGSVARMADGVPRVREVSGTASANGGDWIGIRMSEASVLQGISRLPLLAGFLGLALLLGALAAAWYREGR